jgi:hypothetical protein
MGTAVARGVKINGIKVAKWAAAEFRKKRRGELLAGFFAHVRFVFILLLFATILVFASNHQLEIQSIAAAKLQQLAKKPGVSDKLREKALKYQDEVNQVSQ